MLQEGLYETGTPAEEAQEDFGISHREVSTGADVIDLRAMQQQLSQG